jgi:hypothetical protein
MLNPRTSLLVCLTIMEKRSNVLNQFQRVPKVFEKMVNEIVGVELETVLKTSWITAVTNKKVRETTIVTFLNTNTFAESMYMPTLKYLFLFKIIDGMMGKMDTESAALYDPNEKYENESFCVCNIIA